MYRLSFGRSTPSTPGSAEGSTIRRSDGGYWWFYPLSFVRISPQEETLWMIVRRMWNASVLVLKSHFALQSFQPSHLPLPPLLSSCLLNQMVRPNECPNDLQWGLLIWTLYWRWWRHSSCGRGQKSPSENVPFYLLFFFSRVVFPLVLQHNSPNHLTRKRSSSWTFY